MGLFKKKKQPPAPGGMQPGYPPQQAGYPPQQAGYPPQQGGYPPQQAGYPPQQGGYPPQQAAYAQPQAPAGRQAPLPQGGGGMPAGWGNLGPMAKKTMAIDLSELNQEIVGVVGWLVAMDGNHKGQDFRLKSGKNIIGTAADCDIVITDSYISSKHANIKFESDTYTFIDLDSTNGSFVNDHRVQKEELIDNDVVRLGRTNLKFKALF